MKTKEYVCVLCGTLFSATQKAKYCSPACKQRKQNRKVHSYVCLCCGNQFHRKRNSVLLFCSKLCKRTYMLANPLFKATLYILSQMRDRDTLKYKKRYTDLLHYLMVQLSPRETELDLDAKLVELGITNVRVGSRQENKSKVQSPCSKDIDASKEARLLRRRRIYNKRRAIGDLSTTKAGHQKLRSRLLLLRGSVCYMCGFSGDTDALHIHHKDMDRSNNLDSNLVILCANCHTILHTRIKRNWSSYGLHKLAGIDTLFNNLQAELKERN